jgi:transposase
MRKIREVLRLKWGLDLGDHDIAASCKLSPSTVWEYVRRARLAGLGWPLPEDLDDEQLETKLFPPLPASGVERIEPDWAYVQQERKRKGVTLLLLWEEYITQNPHGYSYVTFTVKYREWKQGTDVTLRQEHKAGEKLFVDYAGQTISLTNPETGEKVVAQIFVATLGASNYTYCEATSSQGLVDWLGSHRRTLEFLGGCPQIIVPDNLKSGVKSPSYYEPELNTAYAEFAQHYGIAVIPARVRKPRDKAKVETGVQIVERQILAPLRNRTFFSLAEANQAIHTLLEELNHKPFQKLLGSRRSVFEALDRPALSPLPAEPYVLAEWKKAKVNLDYHLEVDGHYYSVPYQHARAQVDVRLTHNTVEVYLKGKRIAAHRKVPEAIQYRGRHTTVTEHMPKAHQRHAEWTPQRLILWAQKIGEHTAKVFEEIMARRPHPEQGFRSCLGIMRLGKSYGNERLEAACKRACHFRAFSHQSVQSILQKRLDTEPLPETNKEKEHNSGSNSPTLHTNVRGAAYYNG